MSQYPQPGMAHAEDESRRRFPSSESESKTASSSSVPRKRASRAGTRSVNNLTPAQLDRKRANDREAQRAIRRRTKEQIDGLQHDIEQLKMAATNRDQALAEVQTRARQLEQENAYLRSRVGSDSFMLQIPTGEAKPADSALGGSSAQTSPNTRFSAGDLSRPASQAARGSVSNASTAPTNRPESWRQTSHQPAFSPTESSVTSSSRPEAGRSTSWRTPTDTPTSITSHTPGGHVSMEQAQRSYSTPNAHEPRPSWTGPSGYNYMLDPGQSSAQYGSAGKQIGFQGHQQQSQYAIQTDLPAGQAQHSGYGGSLTTPSAEFQNLSMQSPAQATPTHGHSQANAPYDVHSSHLQPPQTYQGQQPPITLPRAGGLSTPTYPQPPGTSQGYPQPAITQPNMQIDYQSGTGQPGYQYSQYHGSG